MLYCSIEQLSQSAQLLALFGERVNEWRKPRKRMFAPFSWRLHRCSGSPPFPSPASPPQFKPPARQGRNNQTECYDGCIGLLLHTCLIVYRKLPLISSLSYKFPPSPPQLQNHLTVNKKMHPIITPSGISTEMIKYTFQFLKRQFSVLLQFSSFRYISGKEEDDDDED